MAATARPRAYDSHFYWNLRVVVSVWALSAAIFAIARRSSATFISYVGVAALFNPVRQFSLQKEVWSVVDLAVALLALWTLFATWSALRDAHSKEARRAAALDS